MREAKAIKEDGAKLGAKWIRCDPKRFLVDSKSSTANWGFCWWPWNGRRYAAQTNVRLLPLTPPPSWRSTGIVSSSERKKESQSWMKELVALLRRLCLLRRCLPCRAQPATHAAPFAMAMAFANRFFLAAQFCCLMGARGPQLSHLCSQKIDCCSSSFS